MAEEINVGMGPEKPVSSQGERPKGYIRGIWAITIIVAIAILVGGGVWYWYYKTTVQDQTTTNTTKISPSASPTASASTSPSTSGSDETANWQIYTNTTEGFLFKYPPKWTEATENLSKSIITLNSNNEYGPSVEPIIYIVDVTKESNLPSTKYSTDTINNYTVYISKDEPSRSGLIKYYFKKNNNEYIALAFAPYDEQTPYEGQNKEYPYFQKILSTFKFL